MMLRDLFKCNGPNDGTRTLLESVLVPEVAVAINDWLKGRIETGVLIGGLALSYYVKPRFTTDCDLLYLSDEEIPTLVHGFKRTRKGAFLHKQTHVEIEVLTPSSIKMEVELAKQIISTAKKQPDGFRIASREGLIVSKLERFSLQDRADVDALLKLGPADFSSFTLTEKRTMNLEQALADSNK